MKKTLNLTEGPITKELLALSLPIMGTSFIQMAYNMIDMIWVGRIGSNAVAAVGTAGFFTWLAMAFVIISKMGAEVKVSQHIGKKDFEGTKNFVRSSLQINIILSIIYSICMILFRKPLIGFFNLGNAEVIKMSEIYLVAIVFGLPFYFINPVLTSIFNAIGNSKMPFYLNTTGLIVNIILDPILILGFGSFKGLGVLGAAIATVIAQIVVTALFLYQIIKSNYSYLKVNLFSSFNLEDIKTIFKIGSPVAIQSGLFTFFAMILGRIIAVFGAVPIAVQKVGSQIESISWMTTEGLAVALGTFVGQNFGAKKFDRIIKGYKEILKIALYIGIFATILLVFFGSFVFSIFIPEKEAIIQGTEYLKILGYSQIFMCVEITTSGIFNGVSKTHIPSIISIILTGARVPLAYILSSPNILGIDGVWWAVSLTSILKGIVIMFILFKYYKEKKLFD